MYKYLYAIIIEYKRLTRLFLNNDYLSGRLKNKELYYKIIGNKNLFKRFLKVGKIRKAKMLKSKPTVYSNEHQKIII